MAKPSVQSVKAELDTHEAVCTERWRKTLSRLRRLEQIMLGTTATDISGEDASVQAIANAVWTDAVKASYKTWAEAQGVL